MNLKQILTAAAAAMGLAASAVSAQDTYFHVEDVSKADGRVVFEGWLITPARAGVEAPSERSSKPKGKPKPKIKPKIPQPGEVKFVLPMFCKDPKTKSQEEICANLKGMTEDLELDTTYPDDMSYPTR